MDLQYISDSDGKHTAVIVPIDQWNDLNSSKSMLSERFEVNRKKPSDFVGCISRETVSKMILDIEQSRNEWERNI